MGWYQTGDKLLPEPMMTQLTDAYMYMRHLVSMQLPISNVRHAKSPNLIVSRLVLQLSLPNPLNPGVMSRMKM